MKFQTLVSWWLLVPYLLLSLGATSWQIWRIRTKSITLLIKWGRRGSLLVLPALVALGLSVPGGTSAPGIANLDVVFAVDTTPSMGALDYNGTQPRLDGVKKDLTALAAKLQGAHLELVTFDSTANVIMPFTTDATAFATAVQGMTPQISAYSEGSSIDDPISLLTQELKNSKAAYPQRMRLVFYLGDGEQTASGSVQSFAPILPYINGGAVMGYGTTAGAKMPNDTGLGVSTTTPYISTVDSNTKALVPAISQLNPTNLQTIASQLKVTYQDRDQGGSVDSLYKTSHAQLAVDRSQRIVHYLNLYWLFAIPFAGLLFWEWQALAIKLFELRGRSKKQEAGRA